MKPLNKIFLKLSLVLITLISFSFQSNAQALKVGNDVAAIQKSMKLQVNATQLAILIPTVSSDQLQSLEGNYFDQMVFVSGKSGGFFRFENESWIKIPVKEAIAAVTDNIKLMSPSFDNIILSANANQSRNMLDYNGHIESINTLINTQDQNSNMAVRLND